MIKKAPLYSRIKGARQKVLCKVYSEVSISNIHEVMSFIENDEHYNIQMFSEYGEPNHQWMKEIYVKPSDKRKVKQNGKMIKDRK